MVAITEGGLIQIDETIAMGTRAAFRSALARLGDADIVLLRIKACAETIEPSFNGMETDLLALTLQYLLVHLCINASEEGKPN
jgi:hypothetical protein